MRITCSFVVAALEIVGKKKDSLYFISQGNWLLLCTSSQQHTTMMMIMIMNAASAGDYKSRNEIKPVPVPFFSSISQPKQKINRDCDYI